ncbi:prepilin-type N-terminal cleavage/methylation domain-containing protein [Bacillus mesophilus]|uniref:Type II secretion system protein n=1 Tax=Bacillus mesophilus TaxID=1808955 RepID=A0A6M0Q9M7_9BACI|nr:type II secretion system protein [Bacillus mesophilus]MBM7662316.1 prepilin-type N-terminal cleavage/methylation domain-containing protein [Bacillus mesophilus]NEY73054.1 type II secretion system protein [Bacillus mesophilus]
MRNQRGVTLVELLIVILIMVGVSTIGFQLFSYSTNMTKTVAAENELQREARFLLETISNVVRDGGKITEDSTANKTIIADKLDQAQIVYDSVTETLTFIPSNSTLSENISSFNVTEKPISLNRTKMAYSIELVLQKDDFQFAVSTEVFNDLDKRVRY